MQFKENLKQAIQAVKINKLSVYKAAKDGNVPRSTLNNHITGKSKGCKRGRPTAFSETEEKVLADYIKGKKAQSSLINKISKYI